jgi:hypothetical protein
MHRSESVRLTLLPLLASACLSSMASAQPVGGDTESLMRAREAESTRINPGSDRKPDDERDKCHEHPEECHTERGGFGHFYGGGGG